MNTFPIVETFATATVLSSLAPSEDPDDAPLLTPRQTDVVRLAALGLTAKETARRLGISKNTVDEHLRDARRRLGAATKSQLIARAVGLGIV
jgi:DNA-binding CsgD family transcriptional regulator